MLGFPHQLLLAWLLAVPAGSAPAAGRPGAAVDVPARTGTAVVLDVVPRDLLISLGGTPVYRGGYGSALAVDRRSGAFYLLTDRGPSIDRPGPDEKLFVDPSFTPEIGVFRVRGGRLVRTSRIELRDRRGKPLTGLPNPPGRGGTGERPIGPGGAPLELDPNGLDPEGLVVLEDGSFWISDEYGPHLVHLDRRGRTLERINPFSGERRLPAVLALRRPNRGMEGLTYLERERTLVGIMQSPLDNPKAAGRKSNVVRMVFFHLPTGTSRQYLYPLDDPRHEVSEIVALSPRRFLVLEEERIYAADLATAAEVSDPTDGTSGLLVGGRTLEQLTTAEFRAAGIRSASKRLILDLLDPAFDYRHDKAEGLALLGDGVIVVANDDDFGIESGDGGACVPKRNPATGEVDRNRVYLIRPATPLDSLLSE